MCHNFYSYQCVILSTGTNVSHSYKQGVYCCYREILFVGQQQQWNLLQRLVFNHLVWNTHIGNNYWHTKSNSIIFVILKQVNNLFQSKEIILKAWVLNKQLQWRKSKQLFTKSILGLVNAILIRGIHNVDDGMRLRIILQTKKLIWWTWNLT